MPANAAFLIGLTLWLAGQDQRWTYGPLFERRRIMGSTVCGVRPGRSSRPAVGGRIRSGRCPPPPWCPSSRQLDVTAWCAPAGGGGGGPAARRDRGAAATGQTGAAWQRAAPAAADPAGPASRPSRRRSTSTSPARHRPARAHLAYPGAKRSTGSIPGRQAPKAGRPRWPGLVLTGSSSVKSRCYPDTGERVPGGLAEQVGTRRRCCGSAGIQATPSPSCSRTAATRPSSPDPRP